MLLAAVAAAVLAQSPPNLDAGVSYTTRATSVGRAVAALAEQAKADLRVAEPIASDVIVIQAENVRLQDLLDRIAVVTAGRWVTEGATLRLVGDANALQRAQGELLARRAAAIRKDLEERMKPPAPPKTGEKPDERITTEQAMREAMAQETESPSGKALTTFLATLGPNALAGVTQRDRIVFSSAPTGMQRPLPPAMLRTIPAVVAAHNETAKRLREAPPMEATVDNAVLKQMEASMPWLREMQERQRRAVTEVGKVLVVLDFGGFAAIGGMGSLTASLRVYDQRGRLAITDETQVNPDYSFLEAIPDIGEDGTVRPRTAPAGQTRIEPSPETKLLMDASGSMMAMDTVTDTLKPSLRKLLEDPVAWDPLAFGATDKAFALAKKEGKPLVAVLPDSEGGMFLLGAGLGSVEQYVAQIERQRTLQRVADPRWVVLRPVDLVEARRARLNRPAFRALVQAAQTHGVPSLDDVAKFALSTEIGGFSDLSAMLLMWVVPGSLDISSLGMGNWDLIRLYGTLNPMQRRGLADGGTVPIAGMTPVQRQILNRMVFGPGGRVRTVRGEQPAEEDPLLGMMSMFGGMGGGMDLADEPTEAFPTGLPGDGFLRMGVRADNYVTAVVDGRAAPFFQSLGMDELALLQMFSQDTGMIAMAGGRVPKLENVRIGKRTWFNMEILLGPQHKITGRLKDDEPLGSAPTVSMGNLPADFKARLDARVEQLKKSPFGAAGMMGGMRGRPTTPP